MLDQFDVWKYAQNHNCWDFVREFLIDRTEISADDLPKYGILPCNKREMTKAARSVEANFIETGPRNYAIACQYHGKLITHVGVVEGKMVRHTGEQRGTMREPIKKFERNASRTIYMSHKSLCQN